MRVDHVGDGVLEQVDHMNCRTQVVMDDLWQCLARVHTHCPALVTYGPMKYCTHKDHTVFGTRIDKFVTGIPR